MCSHVVRARDGLRLRLRIRFGLMPGALQDVAGKRQLSSHGTAISLAGRTPGPELPVAMMLRPAERALVAGSPKLPPRTARSSVGSFGTRSPSLGRGGT